MTRLDSGRLTAELAVRVAPNPGPMTLDGTNTWIVGDPQRTPPVVVDPGPLLAEHLAAVLGDCGGRIATILLTHRHLDHAEGAATLAATAGCGVRAADPAWCVGSDGLREGDVLFTGTARLEVVATPGHTTDSVSLLLVDEDGEARLLTGDTVLGRGTTVITYPDGDLGRYLASLDRLERLVEERGVPTILPGHGPLVTDPLERLRAYRAHRLARLEEVRQALAAGVDTPAGIVARVYADVDRSVWPAAEQSVRAQLDYLAGGPTSD